MKSGLKGFQRFCGKGDLKILFRRGHDGKWLVNFFFFWREEGSGFLEIPIINVITTLICFSVYMQKERCIICYFSCMF